MAGLEKTIGIGEDLFPFVISVNEKDQSFLIKQSAAAFISESKCILLY